MIDTKRLTLRPASDREMIDMITNESDEILNTFLNRKYIFNIKYFRDKYEYIARDNITKEISNFKK